MVVKTDSFPGSKSVRPDPDVDYDIDNRAAHAADIFRLARRDVSEMNPADNPSS